MGDREVNFLEDMLFKYIDEFKILFFPEQWANVFLECSKNEILTLLLIYRKYSVNMTEVADYIGAPLNTATGVILLKPAGLLKISTSYFNSLLFMKE